jgi:hypothetical protein
MEAFVVIPAYGPRAALVLHFCHSIRYGFDTGLFHMSERVAKALHGEI